MKALVTGGTGFIGRALCAELLRRGWTVDCLARKPERLPTGAVFTSGDVAEPSSLASATGPYDAVFHLAGLITFDRARLPDLMRVNAGGTENVLAALPRWGKPRFVLVSSAITCGISDSPLVMRNEKSAPDGADCNPYMQSKLLAEQAALAAAARGTDALIVNPTTVYGPGDYTLNSGSLIKTILKAPVVPAGSGGCNVADVEDVVCGIAAAYEKGRAGSRYILGGYNMIFTELYRKVTAAAGARTIVVPLPRFLRLPAALAAGFAEKTGLGGRFITSQIVNDLFKYKYYSTALADAELDLPPRRPFEDTLRRALEFYRREGLL
ncbi:MAG: NAD-dependent epimerase/dehydratase family protein [Elusimicrobia bacterium]|nr:NAD-dependent epimerase/dehydratase family protein [Elusimicrobiota bacterium]